MRFVVYGAGAVGGVIGSELFAAGHDVRLIARGEHGAAIAREGLRCELPERVRIQRIPVAAGPAEIDWSGEDVVVVLAVKSQDSAGALAALEAAAGCEVSVACAQNGVENERVVLRRFARAYSVVVVLPATHIEPGVVVAHSAPVTGLLDIGCVPDGVDRRCVEIAAALSGAGFVAEAREDISRWKYAKLLRNLANAVDALFADPEGAGAAEVTRLAIAEGVAVLAAAGIDHVPLEQFDRRHRELITLRPVTGRPREGGSSWQSLARGTGAIETEQLNGEVVLLGRRHGVATPVNEALRRLAGEAARTGAKPRGLRDAAAFLRAAADG